MKNTGNQAEKKAHPFCWEKQMGAPFWRKNAAFCREFGFPSRGSCLHKQTDEVSSCLCGEAAAAIHAPPHPPRKALRSCGCICAAVLYSILQRNSCVPTIDRILYNMYTKIKLQVVERPARVFAYAFSRSYPTPSEFHIPHAEKKGAAPCRSITWPKPKKSLPS